MREVKLAPRDKCKKPFNNDDCFGYDEYLRKVNFLLGDIKPNYYYAEPRLDAYLNWLNLPWYKRIFTNKPK